VNRPTIKDVAKRANVSLKTVSRVINNETSVRDDTRERIQRAERSAPVRFKGRCDGPGRGSAFEAKVGIALRQGLQEARRVIGELRDAQGISARHHGEIAHGGSVFGQTEIHGVLGPVDPVDSVDGLERLLQRCIAA